MGGMNGKLTDQELSRRIAEKLEPEPTWKNQSMAFQWSSYVSDGGLWLRPSMSAGIEPRPMMLDPAMTVMLLKLPGFVSLTLLDEACGYEAVFCGETKHGVHCGAKMATAVNRKLGRAVAESFAGAKGLL